jgi:4a-hydroxytetrahydrobiopterin dehydratase
MSRELLESSAVTAGLTRLDPAWSGDTSMLKRSIEFADFATAVEFVSRVAPFADELDHHPDLHLSWRWVRIELSTHSAGGVTALDLQLAGVVDEVAAGLPLA